MALRWLAQSGHAAPREAELRQSDAGSRHVGRSVRQARGSRLTRGTLYASLCPRHGSREVLWSSGSTEVTVLRSRLEP